MANSLDQNPPLIEIRGEGWRCTNTGVMKNIIFSLKKRKFIKGRQHFGADYNILYRLYPGKYLRFSWGYWNKEYPPHTISVELIRINADGEIRVLKSATWRLCKDDADKLPVIVRDFFFSRPAYHGSPWLPLNKVYSEEEVEEVLRYLRPEGNDIVLGEENW